MREYRSDVMRGTVGMMVAIAAAALPGCSTDEVQPAATNVTVAALDTGRKGSVCADGEARALFGLYESKASFEPDLPSNAIDYVMLQPGCTAIGFTGTQNFGAFTPTPPGFPSNAVGSLLTWHVHQNAMEVRMLRPLFVPTGSAFPSQRLLGYLRGLIPLERQADGTWLATDAQVEAVELIQAVPCANTTQHAPCVIRQYSGSVTLTAMDAWDTGVPSP